MADALRPLPVEPTHPLQTASLATFRGDALTDLLAGLAANSMGSFVKGFTPLRASVASLCTTDILAKTCGHGVAELKTYRSPKRRARSILALSNVTFSFSVNDRSALGAIIPQRSAFDHNKPVRLQSLAFLGNALVADA
jgi:hypothetical protein